MDRIKSRKVYFKRFYDIFQEKGKIGMIDEGLLIYFQEPKSYTGEEMIEFQFHGGNAVKQKMLQCLS